MISIYKEVSVDRPGMTKVIIFGESPEEVEAEFTNLADVYGRVEGRIPAKCPDGRWTIMAYVA